MSYPHLLPPLPYAYDALEPHLDARTLEIHYSKHHQAYLNGLNKTIEPYAQLHALEIHQLLADLAQIPEPIRQAVVNFGGGAYHHDLFWRMMSPDGHRTPRGQLATAIDAQFGSYDSFRQTFSKVAATFFGSGWVWLCADADGVLSVVSTSNQDSPVSRGLEPLLGVDVWEHAYYLKFQNRRTEFIEAWWQVVDWAYAHERYAAIITR